MSTEKVEKEIKQINFRIDQASADAFRSFCTAHGMNQAQGFDHLLQVLELNNAKTTTPGRAVEIENFERLTKDLLAAYLTSIELSNTAEARVLERFKADLQRKDRTIDELREKAERMAVEKKEISESIAAITDERDRIQEKASHMEQAMEAAQKSSSDQEQLNHVLKSQLEELQTRVVRYDEVVQLNADLKSKIEHLESRQNELSHQLEMEISTRKACEKQTDKLTAAIKDLERAATDHKVQTADLQRQLKEKDAESQNLLQQARMQADLELERAVVAKEREMQDELRKSDRENARLLAELEHLRSALEKKSAN